MTQLEPDRESDYSAPERRRILATNRQESLGATFINLVVVLMTWGLIAVIVFLIVGFLLSVSDYYRYYETGSTLPGRDGGWLYWAGYYLFRAGLAFYQLPARYYNLIHGLAQTQGMSLAIKTLVLASPLAFAVLLLGARALRFQARAVREYPDAVIRVLSLRQYLLALVVLIASLDISLFAKLYGSYCYLIGLAVFAISAASLSNLFIDTRPCTARQFEETLALINSVSGSTK